ncbi:MAG: hypothetical protein V3V61_07375 [Gammaproteobacteria bacterium]
MSILKLMPEPLKKNLSCFDERAESLSLQLIKIFGCEASLTQDETQITIIGIAEVDAIETLEIDNQQLTFTTADSLLPTNLQDYVLHINGKSFRIVRRQSDGLGIAVLILEVLQTTCYKN